MRLPRRRSGSTPTLKEAATAGQWAAAAPDPVRPPEKSLQGRAGTTISTGARAFFRRGHFGAGTSFSASLQACAYLSAGADDTVD